jgi:OOP family OmpA-OmpF porin
LKTAKPENTSAEQRLQSLRAALLSDEQQHVAELQRQLDALRQELAQQQLTPEHLAPLLAESLDLAQSSEREALAGALNAVVAESVKESVRADKDSFAEALSPMIGAAIRKAITNALKGFNQAINQAVEHSLSMDGLRWRWEAWRTGVPYAQLIMRHTLPYVVEEAFLIHNDSGLLVAHASSSGRSKVDNDAVSAMLTAIQDFVRDSFAVGDGQLEEVEIGGRMVWVINGSRMSFAVVVHGTPPVSLREDMDELLQRLHVDYAEEISAFAADGKMVEPLVEELQDLIAGSLEGARQLQPKGRIKSRLWFWWLLLVALLSFFAWNGWQQWHQHQQLQAVKQQLELREDLIVMDWVVRGDVLLARGLYDPVFGIVDQGDYLPEGLVPEVDWLFAPYRSALPEAAVADKREHWSVPPSVDLVLRDGRWRAHGEASMAWVQSMRALAHLGLPHPDVGLVVVPEAELAKWLADRLPSGVQAKLQGQVLQLTGRVEMADELLLAEELRHWYAGNLLMFTEVDTSALRRVRASELLRLGDLVAQQDLEFATGVVMSPAGWASMQQLADRLKRWIELAADEIDARVVLFHDATELAARRAEKLRGLLQQQAVMLEVVVQPSEELVQSDTVDAVGVVLKQQPLPALAITL